MKNTIRLIGIAMVIMISALLFSNDVQAAGTNIADKFEKSFVNAVCEKYSITEEEFTTEWATKQTRLELSNMEIGGIDKGGNNPNVLAQYFPNLEKLDLSNNELGGLPNFPATLKEIDCSGNNIDGLPNFPAGLTKLNVNNNKLVALPNLPATLIELNVEDNNLEGLPDLPAGLKVLNVNGNGLEALPALPAGVITTYQDYQIYQKIWLI